MKGIILGFVALAALTSCSSGVDEDAWRADLANAGVTYPSDKIWESYRDVWLDGCDDEGLDKLVREATTQIHLLDETWDQVKINVEHACPDRVEEVAAAVAVEPWP